MRGGLATVGCVLVLFTLAACGERAQTMTATSQRKADTPGWEGAASSPFMAPGWKPGDKASWEAQLRNRAQSQNDFAVAK